MENVFGIFQYLGLMVTQPGKKSHRLAGQDRLVGHGIDLFFSAISAPFVNVFPGTHICRHDTVVAGFSVVAYQIQTFTVTGKRHTGDILRIDTTLFDGKTNSLSVDFPELIHVTLGIAGLWCDGDSGDTGYRDLCTVFVENGCFGEGAAIVDTH